MKSILLGLLFAICATAPLFSDNINLIKQKIKTQYEHFYKDNNIEIESITPYFTQDSKINDVEIKAIYFSDNSLPSTSSLKIEFIYNHKSFTQILNYDVKANIKAIYAKTTIKKNQDITSEITYTKTIPLSMLKTPLLTQKDLNSVGAKVQIPSNTLITISQITGKILIHQNEPFIAIYHDGGILIQTTLIAKQDGRKNDIIQALNPESKKIIRVRVLENGNGEIL